MILFKSEAFVLGCSVEQSCVANILNSKLGSIPTTYLGIPIFPLKLLAGDFRPTELKFGSRVAPWRGRYQSTTGKVTLINSSMSSPPTFIMGFYRLYDNDHACFDRDHSAFYWNTMDNKKKYMMVKWKIMCRPKSLGGLGIINTSLMNKCLIMKWCWCLYNDPLRVCGEQFSRANVSLIVPLSCPPLVGALSSGELLSRFETNSWSTEVLGWFWCNAPIIKLH